MNELKLDTTFHAAQAKGDLTTKDSILNFIELMALDLLQSNDIDPSLNMIVTKQSFLNELKSEILNTTCLVMLSENSSLIFEYDSFCSFEYNTQDETENGGGAKGSVCGVENAYIEIKRVLVNTSDGSYFFLNYDNKVTDYLLTILNIE
jgi:hypothetical protein